MQQERKRAFWVQIEPKGYERHAEVDGVIYPVGWSTYVKTTKTARGYRQIYEEPHDGWTEWARDFSRLIREREGMLFMDDAGRIRGFHRVRLLRGSPTIQVRVYEPISRSWEVGLDKVS